MRQSEHSARHLIFAAAVEGHDFSRAVSAAINAALAAEVRSEKLEDIAFGWRSGLPLRFKRYKIHWL
jgi:hypothetical protein